MGNKKGRIKKTKGSQGDRVKPQETTDYENMPPVFSLEKLIGGKYCLSGLSEEHKAKFADAIFRRKNISWRELKSCGRHGLGMEKIARSAFGSLIGKLVTDDVDYFLAFRYNGMHPMVGYRQKNVFFVLWFDHDFTLYDHS